jgi:flavin reductase (DIM6/NTAB) family NADH-FMN oxidoreductase RutF
MTTDDHSRIVDRLDWPMVVVTVRADDDGELGGCLVGFHTQCSMVPLRHVVLISKVNHTWTVAQRSSELAVHVLADHQIDLARAFGEMTDDESPGDKWGAIEVDDHDGPPIITAARAWFAGPIVATFDAGDHVAFVVEPARSALDDAPFTQLGFQAVRGFHPGHPAG